MAKWDKETLKLKPNHGWRVKPGYHIFVMDRGAVRFNIPQGWIIKPGSDSIKIHDREPPDDDCVLAVSYLRLPPGIDWSGLPVREMVRVAVEGDSREVSGRGEMIEEERGDLSLAWTEVRFTDPNEQREAFSRICIARGANHIQSLITFDFWATDAARLHPVWDEVLRSLEVGWFIADPTQGPVVQ
jgi:hypothetical protein